MHPDNKKDNCEHDKPELGDIDIQTLVYRKEKGSYHFDDRVEKKADQSCQEFEFIPFHGKNDSNTCNQYLDDPVQDHAGFKKCREHSNPPIGSTLPEVLLNSLV